jgi:hypothetical protein
MFLKDWFFFHDCHRILTCILLILKSMLNSFFSLMILTSLNNLKTDRGWRVTTSYLFMNRK